MEAFEDHHRFTGDELEAIKEEWYRQIFEDSLVQD